MRIGLLADLHANLEATEACLARLRDEGVDRLAFLGDLVGYGADPGPVVDLVAEHVARGALAVLGNHDAAAVTGDRAGMHAAAAAALAWTHARLGAGRRAFLAALPLAIREGPLVLVHGTADAPGAWTYATDGAAAERSLEAADAPYVVAGHVHDPVLFYAGAAGRAVPFRPTPGVRIPVAPHRRWLAVPGAAGQPRDGNPAACCAVLDVGRATLTFLRVAYDRGAAAGKVRAAGLPEALALRLESGT